MTKYNVRDFKETATSYQDTISPDVLDVLYTKILNVLLVEKKFMLKDYSAKMLAKDLNTNSRYISRSMQHSLSHELCYSGQQIQGGGGHVHSCGQKVYSLEDGRCL